MNIWVENTNPSINNDFAEKNTPNALARAKALR